MSKFVCFTDEAMDYAIENADALEQKIRENPSTNDWLEEYFKNHKFKGTLYNFDFELKYDSTDPSKYDFENAKGMYELFEDLKIKKVVAYNEKFMVSFALHNGYRYYTAHLMHPKSKIKSIKGTMLYGNETRRSVARNTVGRLYLLACLSVDNRLKDKFFYTKYVMEHAGLRRMQYYTYVDNDIARLSLIKSVYDYEKSKKKKLSIDKVNKLLTHLSCLSNVSAVFNMTEEEVIADLTDYIKEIDK
ncbi:MAG: DUF6339 family protein [Bacilli bacterium]|nr:DUF6339 family protein [Bacilli bacterium]